MDTKIRHTEISDLPSVMRIYAYAREQMKLNGNPNQWGDNRPTEDSIVNDIQNRNSYVIEKGGVLCGVFAFIIGEDSTYKTIEGQWINHDDVYGAIHRVASGGIIRGVFERILEFCESKISNLRVDTHQDNKIMQHKIEKNGFVKCGIIYLEDGSPRIAYQKVITDQNIEE